MAYTETVLCIPAFFSSARQYRGLVQRLQPRFRIVTADLYGHGDRAPWQSDRLFTMADEAAPLEAFLPDDAPAHVVGHSYGAAVALRIAAANRGLVRSMVLYEPTLWGTLARERPRDAGTLEIEAVRDDTVRLIREGSFEAAAERFMDYWAGPGAWAATPAPRRASLLSTARLQAEHAWHAAFAESWTLAALQALEVPSLLLSGTRSTAAARSAFGLLRANLPAPEVIEFDGFGHLAPVTNPQHIEEAIDRFLSRRSAAAAG